MLKFGSLALQMSSFYYLFFSNDTFSKENIPCLLVRRFYIQTYLILLPMSLLKNADLCGEYLLLNLLSNSCGGDLNSLDRKAWQPVKLNFLFLISSNKQDQQVQNHQIYWTHNIIDKKTCIKQLFTYILYCFPSMIYYRSVNLYQQTISNKEMKLNPFNPNYLNQICFDRRHTKSQHQVHKAEPKSSQRQIQSVNVNFNPPVNNQNSTSISANFSLQNHLNSSHLHYTSEGFLIAFLRKSGNISGKSFIMFPQGIVANCNVINRRLSGWICICKKGQFYNLSHFFAGKFHGIQYTYDLKCGLTLQSSYQCGKLQSVKRGVADNKISFQKLLKNKELVELLNETLTNNFYQNYYPKINSTLGTYYGSKSKSIPSGVGVLVTENECFYGNFQYGLLSGDGVMIFPNGNSYIGQFQEGMMGGFGNFINNGASIYKLNETVISQIQYKNQVNVESFYENQELNAIFGPIINFYQKLKLIYQNRRKQEVEQPVSFVDVEVQNLDENGQQQKDQRSSSNYSPRQDMISELLNINNSKQTINIIQSDKKNGYKNHKSQVSKETALNLKGANAKKEEQLKTQQKQQPHKNKNKKDKWMIKDHEWNEIIQELGEEYVSRQDDFLNPQEEHILTEDPQALKKNPINSRISAQNMMKVTDNHPQTMDALQNQLIGKIINKK